MAAVAAQPSKGSEVDSVRRGASHLSITTCEGSQSLKRESRRQLSPSWGPLQTHLSISHSLLPCCPPPHALLSIRGSSLLAPPSWGHVWDEPSSGVITFGVSCFYQARARANPPSLQCGGSAPPSARALLSEERFGGCEDLPCWAVASGLSPQSREEGSWSGL